MLQPGSYAPLPDARLRQRRTLLVTALAKAPEQSLSQVCSSGGALKAAYRFLG